MDLINNETVYDRIWALEHQHDILCRSMIQGFRCQQPRIILPHKPDAETVVQRKEVNGNDTLHCFYKSGGRGDKCFFHTQKEKDIEMPFVRKRDYSGI